MYFISLSGSLSSERLGSKNDSSFLAYNTQDVVNLEALYGSNLKLKETSSIETHPFTASSTTTMSISSGPGDG